VAGQHLGLGFSDLVLSSGTYFNVYVYGTSGTSTVATTTCNASYGGCQFNLSPSETGNYHVVVTPQSAAQTMQFNVTLSQDLTGALQRDVPSDVALLRHGQNARLRFTAQAGESLALQVAGQSTEPLNRTVSYSVYKPDGSLLKTLSLNSTNYGTSYLADMPVSGEYEVLVGSSYGEISSAHLTLTGGANTVLDGNALQGATSYAGQPMYFNVPVVAGQHLGLGFSDLVLSSGTYFNVYVYGTSGTSTVATTTCSASYGGCQFNLSPSETGNYHVVVTPQSATQTMQFNVTLSQDLTGALQRDVPLDVTLPRRGQNARLKFTAAAGDSLALQVAGQATEPLSRTVYYSVYKPDGSLFKSFSLGNPAYGTLYLADLPVGGEYEVLVDSKYGETSVAKATLATGRTDLVPDDDTINFWTTSSNQSLFLRLPVIAGQHFGLGMDNLSVSTGSNFNVTIYDQAGAGTSATCSVSRVGCEFDLNPTTSGTYGVIVSPQSAGQTIVFSGTYTNDVATTMKRGDPLVLSLWRPGQNGTVSFSATAGENLTLTIAGQTTWPTTKSTSYIVYRPDGVVMKSASTSSSSLSSSLGSMPLTGEYRLAVDPSDASTLNVTLTIQ
jgi:hypothetical protein